MGIYAPNKTDKAGYNAHYKGQELTSAGTKDEFLQGFKDEKLTPFFQGGHTKGYVLGLATKSLMEAIDTTGKQASDVTILDAGSGSGKLSAYLACQGYNVVGVDISEEGCAIAEGLAKSLDASKRCSFRAESLESIGLSDSCIDFVIGHASLHHFVKYEGVASELYRLLKPGGQGFFADSFSENKLYHVFHDKEKMERLGDVSLTRTLHNGLFRSVRSRAGADGLVRHAGQVLSQTTAQIGEANAAQTLESPLLAGSESPPNLQTCACPIRLRHDEDQEGVSAAA